MLWKPINHKLLFNYQISNTGKIRDWKNRIIEWEMFDGLYRVTLANGNATGKRKVTNYFIHELMQLTFPEELGMNVTYKVYRDEIWKPIIRNHFCDGYEISNFGRVRLSKTFGMITPGRDDTYLFITMFINNKCTREFIHKL